MMIGGRENNGGDGNVSLNLTDLLTILKNGNLNSAKIANYLRLNFAAQTASLTVLASSYHASGGVLVSSAPGYLVALSVTSASTGATGLCFDSASVANSTTGNAFAIIPSSGYIVYNWPYQNGLVINPSSQGTHIVSVSYVNAP